MRILHTADWHLNNRLGRIKRQGDIVARLEEIAGYLVEHRVDVMVVAGDVFSENVRYQDLQDSIASARQIFTPFLLGEGTIIAIIGNHEDARMFRSLALAMDLASPVDAEHRGPYPRGRLYLASEPTSMSIMDKAGLEVQFGLLPYPTPRRYGRDVSEQHSDLEEKEQALKRAVLGELERMSGRKGPEVPGVLVGHLHVSGSELHNLFNANSSRDIMFEGEELAEGWAYVALGHIHKAQALRGLKHVRYAGSVERLDAAERSDDKSVTLIDIDRSGLVDEPRMLPLNATPIYVIEIADAPSELPLMKERYPDAERALVKYELKWQPGRDNRREITRQLESVFPRWYDRKTQVARAVPAQAQVGRQSISAAERQDVLGTVQGYLSEQMREDPDREDVLSLVKDLLSEEGVH